MFWYLVLLAAGASVALGTFIEWKVSLAFIVLAALFVWAASWLGLKLPESGKVLRWVFVLAGVWMMAVSAVFVFHNLYDSPEQYTDWDFHRCMAAGSSPRECSNSIVPLRGVALEQNNPNLQGYDWYPPAVAWIGHVVPLEWVLLALTLCMYVGLFLAGRGPLAPVLFLMLTREWTFSMMRAGLLPFFLVLDLVLAVFVLWPRAGVKGGVLLSLAALLVHRYGWVFVVASTLAMWWAKGDAKRASMVLLPLALGALAFTLSAWALEMRPLWLVALFGSVLAGVSQTQPSPGALSACANPAGACPPARAKRPYAND